MALFPSNPEDVRAFAKRLRRGETLVLPTETVYGLGGDATNPEAIANIYKIKQRPQFNPLICHVPSERSAKRYGVFNATASKLAAAFWPGALTLVVPKQKKCRICDLASAGLDSIALRVPSHPVMLDILQQVKRPIAAPSANLSGRLSPTRPEMVRQSMPELDVMDGGYCKVGMESTIIGCLGELAVYLRAGGIDRAEIEAVLGEPLANVPDEKEEAARLAPGRLPRHYAPHVPLQINCERGGEDMLLLGFGDNLPDGVIGTLSASGDLREASANLFAFLYELDLLAQEQNKSIGVVQIPNEGLGEAINDRLQRAAAGSGR